MSLKAKQTVSSTQGRSLRALMLLARYGLSSIPFIEVGAFLLGRPANHALLLFFLPPIIAALFILADNGRFDRTVLRGAWILLMVTAFASFLAEINVPPIKPQFAGILPLRVDRVFVCYLIGWYTFVLVICPIWFLRWRIFGPGRSRGPIDWKFKLCLATWLVGVTAMGILAGRKLL